MGGGLTLAEQVVGGNINQGISLGPLEGITRSQLLHRDRTIYPERAPQVILSKSKRKRRY